MIPITKKNIIITSVILVIICTLLFVWFIVDRTRNSYGQFITINNYDELIDNLPKERKDFLQSSLYNTVKTNISNEDSLNNIRDAEIRTKSVVQSYDKESGGSYSGRFIIDIASIEQTYIVEYKHLIDPVNQSVADEYMNLSCPRDDDIIFENQICKEILSSEVGDNKGDPVLRYIPHSTLNYSAEQDYSIEESDNIGIRLTIFLSNIDIKTGREAAIDKYIEDFSLYLEEKGLNPDEYFITTDIREP